VLEGGRVFDDPLAVRILGAEAEAALRDAGAHPEQRGMRLFVAVRSRFAEDALARAIARGTRQLVILGAGLDTYAYRAQSGLRVFEVDHPDTQAWKRACLEEAAIPVPENLTFAPIDFERGTLADGLEAAGFDRARETFFTWLGVTVYLSEEAVWSTLGWIGRSPGGAHVVFDYGEPVESLPDAEQGRAAGSASRAEAVGEPWISFFEPRRLRVRLTELGFRDIEDLGRREIAERYFGGRGAPTSRGGGHVVWASTLP
jgi:methyltransferase (TIGR00027 family)